MTYITGPAHARKELARLHGIRASLARNIASLDSDQVSQKSADTWRKIYTERLQQNVYPAIKECEAYIKYHS